MDFLDNITSETLVICSNGDKEKLLFRNKLINIKLMNIDEFIKKYVFDYDERTILYIMRKYNLKYEIAHMYLKNLYYIENKHYGIKKLDILVDIKKSLDENGLLIYNKYFKDYVKNVSVIVYGIKLNKYEKSILGGINYRFVEKKYNKFEHDILYFDTLEEEVEYIASNICSLIDSGIDVKKIKLTNIDNSYYNTLVRIFSLFGLKVNISYNSLLSSYDYVKNVINLFKTEDLDVAISKIDKNDKLYDEVVSVINKYLKYNDKELIIYKLEHAYINSYVFDNGIDIVDYLDYSFDDDDYVFFASFNDGLVPNSFRDTDYITDNIKCFLNLDTTKDKNVALRENILKSIYNIRNLCITYKLRDIKKTFYPSSLCSEFNVLKGQIDTSFSYSEVYNKIKLTKSIDDYIKYGTRNSEFERLYNNFKVNYNSYDNKYTLINRVMDKLNLSYSKMQIYNKCAFRYYLNDILKLDPFVENFATVIGNMVHFVLEKCLSNNDMDVDKYVNLFLEGRALTHKEAFFLEKYKEAISELLDQIVLEKEYSSFDCALYEKKIEIDYGNGIRFSGIIDKILYKEENDKTYVTLVDYKTGDEDISLKYLNYGLNIQLPIYLYLSNYLNFRNVLYSGFYLQKFNITDKDYRLIGYSNSDSSILSIMDSNYENSKIIKGMKTLKNGSFSRYTKVLDNNQMEEIKGIAKNKICEVIENIKNNKFTINPKVIGDKCLGCDYCKYRDICFVKKVDRVVLKEDEFEGDIDGLD